MLARAYSEQGNSQDAEALLRSDNKSYRGLWHQSFWCSSIPQLDYVVAQTVGSLFASITDEMEVKTIPMQFQALRGWGFGVIGWLVPIANYE